jgi:predicted transcriptional regulator
MKAKNSERQQAIQLRKRGLTLNEIAERLHVAKSSVSLWVRNVQVSKVAELRLQKKKIAAQHTASQVNRLRTQKKYDDFLISAKNSIHRHPLPDTHAKLVCALLYWCEGAKHTNRVEFTNADPDVISLFLRLLRKSFLTDESRFRVCVHLHSYHNSEKQISYWSTVTGIPENQFTKPYKKKHTANRIRENYQGCASIRYHDANLARQLHALAQAALELY